MVRRRACRLSARSCGQSFGGDSLEARFSCDEPVGADRKLDPLSVAFLCNAGDVNPIEVGRRVAAVFLAQVLVPEQSTRSTQPDEKAVRAVAGVYRNTTTGALFASIGAELGCAPTMAWRWLR